MIAWSFDAVLWTGSIVALAAVIRGTKNRRNRAATLALFVAAVFMAIVALSPWIDDPAGRLLWVHMTQHLLLIVVAAPLFVLARPGPAFLASLAPGTRRRVGRTLRGVGARAPDASAIAVLAGSAAVIALLGWHVPVAFDAAVRNDAVHAFEHVTLFGTAVWFWWTVLDARARRREGAGLAIASLTMVTFAGAALGALMVFSPRPWFGVYAAAEGRAAALHDQQLAGILMWIPPSAIFLAVTAYVFVAWLERAAADELERVTRVRT